MAHQAHAQIRVLTSADAARYRDVRLEGLKQNPEAFESTFERESRQPLTWFEGRISHSRIYGAFMEGELLGVAGYVAQDGPKQAHKAVLWGMYVRAVARRAGLGKRLVEAVMQYASERVELLQLTVIRENQIARDMYAKLGFVEYGCEMRALKHDERYYDEILMVRVLAPGKATPQG